MLLEEDLLEFLDVVLALRPVSGAYADEAADDLDVMMEEGREQWHEAKANASDAADRKREEVDDFVRYLFEEGKDLWERMKEEGPTTGKHGKDQAHKTGH